MHMDVDFLNYADQLRRRLRRTHHNAMKRCNEHLQPLTYVDVFFAGALRRSYSLTRGFFQLLLARNFTCTAPLVRLQLDNALRITACVYAEPDAAGFVQGLLAGTRVDRMRDRSGERMTDKYLCSLLAIEYPWVQDVYRECSGFVHLSEKHMLQAVAATGASAGAFKYTLAEIETDVPKAAWEEVTTTFAELTSILIALILSWPEARAERTPAG